MDSSLIQLILQRLIPVETALLVAAGFMYFRKCGNTFAESVAYAIMAVMMLLSFLFQISLLSGLRHISTAGEVLACVIAVILIIRYRYDIYRNRDILLDIFQQHRVLLSLFFLACLYLLAQSLLIPPVPDQWEGLARIGLCGRIGGPPGHPVEAKGLIPPNGLILPYMMLRFHTGAGAGVFGFLAYLSIVFSTYALSRRYAWPRTALAVSLIVAGMSRLVLHAATPGFELVPAAAALFSLLALNRTIETPNMRDFSMLLLGMAFALSDNIPSIIFPAVTLALSTVLMVRRHGFEVFLFLAGRNKTATAVLALPLLVFLQIPLLWAGFDWPCLNVNYTDNIYGLPGAIANIIKYAISSAHFTLPAEQFCRWAAHFSLVGFFERICRILIAPLGKSVGGVPFSIAWKPDASLSWFGPLAFLIIVPSVFLALLRGHRRIKAVSVGLVSYIILIALLSGWSIENVRFFTIFFTCAGFCSAFLLPPWRLTEKGAVVLQTISLILLFYAAFFNVNKPLIRFSGATPGSSTRFAISDFKQMIRKGFANGVWGTIGLKPWDMAPADMRLLDTIPRNSDVGVIGDSYGILYPYMMSRPDLRFFPVDPELTKTPKKPAWDYLLDLGPESKYGKDPQTARQNGNTDFYPVLITPSNIEGSN